MAGIEFLLIDENTRMAEFKDKLRWNDLYDTLSKTPLADDDPTQQLLWVNV